MSAGEVQLADPVRADLEEVGPNQTLQQTRPAYSFLRVDSILGRAGLLSYLFGHGGGLGMCSICEKSAGGDFDGLDELAANVPRSTYLCRCPHCGALWMGHAYTPQLMIELTGAVASAEFPGWDRPS